MYIYVYMYVYIYIFLDYLDQTDNAHIKENHTMSLCGLNKELFEAWTPRYMMSSRSVLIHNSKREQE